MPGERSGSAIRGGKRTGSRYSAAFEKRTCTLEAAESSLRLSKNREAAQIRLCGRDCACWDAPGGSAHKHLGGGTGQSFRTVGGPGEKEGFGSSGSERGPDGCDGD